MILALSAQMQRKEASDQSENHLFLIPQKAPHANKQKMDPVYLQNNRNHLQLYASDAQKSSLVMPKP